jgi:hypothetical protein
VLAAAVTWAALNAAVAHGQGRSLGPLPQSLDTFQSVYPDQPRAYGGDTGVAFIDSALPRGQVRTRFDGIFENRQPTRAEWFQAKGGLPLSPGPPLLETRVDALELMAYGEVALFPTFSTFMETPLRLVNPQMNENEGGFGDLNLGFKWGFYSTSTLLTTFQFRAYLPTAGKPSLGTDHVSLEPALLVNYRVLDFMTLEGELRYWAPIGGTDFAGDVVRYGVGLTYWGRSATQIWITPVVEAVGWTILDGKSLVVHGPSAWEVREAGGQTIVNVNAGLRIGFGSSAELYGGYGRSVTGHSWFKDMFRVEFRVLF